MCTYIAAFTTVNFDSTVSIETMAAVGGNSFNVFYQETCSVTIENEVPTVSSLFFEAIEIDPFRPCGNHRRG